MDDVVAAPAPQNLLDQHAEELAAHAEAIRDYGKRTVESVLEIGRHLAEVKKLLGYGSAAIIGSVRPQSDQLEPVVLRQ